MILITQVLLIIIAVLLFGFIIFIHEFGHFFTAKLSGIRVNEFSIGMGPKLLQFGKKETKYSLRLLPIGGYCAMEGEDEESEDERAFNNRPVWKRILVVAMGAIMNILLGFVLMVILTAQTETLASTTIAWFDEQSPLQSAGAELGDRFTKIDGYTVNTDRDLLFALSTADPTSVDIELDRQGQKILLNDVAMNTQDVDGQKIVRLDFKVAALEKKLGTILTKSAEDTVSTVRLVWYSLAGLVTGKFGLNDVAGPVGAASAIGQAASAGLESGFGDAINNILYMMMIITVNLGIVNLLPLPALDGGRLVFLVIEGIRRKPVNPKYEGWVHAAGFALLMVFMVVITFSDILRLFTGKGIGG